MRRPPLVLVLTLAFALIPAFAACGGDSADNASADSASDSPADAMQQAAEAMEEAASRMRSGSSDDAPEPMTAEQMQEALPDELAGMERTSSERQSMGAAGMSMAQAQATYEGDGRKLEVQLMSGLGILAGPAMAFTMMEFDRTTDDGYERTIEYDGMPGMQEYSENGDDIRAMMMLLLNDRVMVRLEADGMTMGEVEAAYDELDIG